MPTYNLLSTQLPVMPTPTTGLQNPASVTPLLYDAIIAGETVNARPKVNRNTVRDEMIGRHGGGVYAVQTGLNLAIGSGLNVVVQAGQAIIDGPRTVAANTNVAVSNAITNGTVWMTQAGALSASVNLTPPAGNVCFLGFYTTAGGVVTAVDESGVLRLDQGNTPLRRTADTSVPGDTPPSTLRFWNKCPGGLFLWDGLAWNTAAGDQGATLPLTIGSTESWVIPAGRQAVIATLSVLGSLTVNGLLKVVGD